MPARAFEYWWAELRQKNPGLLDEDATIRLTVAQLKSNMRKAFLNGALRGSSAPTGPAAELLDAIFGTGPRPPHA